VSAFPRATLAALMSAELTLDSSATIDLLDEDQDRHPLAPRLLDLAKAGRVELAVAASGHNLDHNENAARRRRELEREGVITTVQLAYPGRTNYPGDDAVPGAADEGFRAAWDAVLATWKSHEGAMPSDTDALHVESHLLERRDVFITDDRDLLVMCRRLAEEHSLPLVARPLAEYV
jgi:hypothetical protein